MIKSPVFKFTFSLHTTLGPLEKQAGPGNPQQNTQYEINHDTMSLPCQTVFHGLIFAFRDFNKITGMHTLFPILKFM